MMKINIFTDGACSGNPGPGGWAAILKCPEKNLAKEIFGGDPHTTNNRMELTAVISALSALKFPCEVTLTTDSKYIVDSINEGRAPFWKARGWRNKANKEVKNPDLWEKLLALLEIHTVTFVWTAGHAGHPENERCDALATQQSYAIQSH